MQMVVHRAFVSKKYLLGLFSGSSNHDGKKFDTHVFNFKKCISINY